MQIKTTVSYRLTPTRTPTSENWQNQTTARTWSNWNSHTLLAGMQNGTTTLKTGLEFLIKLEIYLPYTPTIPLKGIYPSEVKTCASTKTCLQMFLVASCLALRNWEQHGGWINCGISI